MVSLEMSGLCLALFSALQTLLKKEVLIQFTILAAMALGARNSVV